MKCWIYGNDEVLGWTVFRLADPSMGVVHGVFHPLAPYAKLQTLIQATTEARVEQTPLRPEIEEALSRITFSARTEQGEPLEPVAGVLIEDVPALNTIEVSLLGLDWRTIEQHFRTDATDS